MIKLKKFYKDNKKLISVILVLIWALFIFIMSSFNGNLSSNQSSFITSIINKVFNIKDIELIIRKIAHLLEYLILGILVANMLNLYNKKLFIVIILCMLYAISDEVHQLFVIGRVGSIIDVLIDTIGSIIGLFIFKLYKNNEIKEML